MPAKPSKSRKSSTSHEDEVRRVFRTFDRNGDGLIDMAELTFVLQVLDKKTWTEHQLTRLYNVLDTNNNGRVEYEEFIAWAFGHKGVKSKDLNAFRGVVSKTSPKSEKKLKKKEEKDRLAAEEEEKENERERANKEREEHRAAAAKRGLTPEVELSMFVGNKFSNALLSGELDVLLSDIKQRKNTSLKSAPRVDEAVPEEPNQRLESVFVDAIQSGQIDAVLTELKHKKVRTQA